MLSNVNRPAQIGIWLHNGRPWDDMPVISPGVAEDYSTSWWLWWKSLQPSWRSDTLSRDLRATGVFNWSETLKGSQNGFFLLIASLGWWFKGERGMWWCGDAIKDVEWVLDQMIMGADSTSLGKRGRGIHGPPASKRAKVR